MKKKTAKIVFNKGNDNNISLFKLFLKKSIKTKRIFKILKKAKRISFDIRNINKLKNTSIENLGSFYYLSIKYKNKKDFIEKIKKVLKISFDKKGFKLIIDNDFKRIQDKNEFFFFTREELVKNLKFKRGLYFDIFNGGPVEFIIGEQKLEDFDIKIPEQNPELFNIPKKRREQKKEYLKFNKFDVQKDNPKQMNQYFKTPRYNIKQPKGY